MKNFAFTLAEVLITIGIIGVVAAITIPGLITECQKMVIKNQFKEQYSTFQQAIKTVEFNFDYTPNCYYWKKNPYGSNSCVEYSADGNCKKYQLSNGGDLPSDYNGRMGECSAVKEEMKKILKVAQICTNKAYEKGCIPKYKGIDTVKKENDTNNTLTDLDIAKSTSGCQAWRETNILNSREAWVLMDGTIILFYSGFQLFAIDVNGKRGPNKWGYDLFPLQSKSNGDPIELVGGGCEVTEKGGVSASVMIKNLFNKK